MVSLPNPSEVSQHPMVINMYYFCSFSRTQYFGNYDGKSREDRNMVPKYSAERKAILIIIIASTGFHVTRAQTQFNRYDNLHEGQNLCFAELRASFAK